MEIFFQAFDGRIMNECIFFLNFHFEIISTSQKSYKKYTKDSYTYYQFVTFCRICLSLYLYLYL